MSRGRLPKRPVDPALVLSQYARWSSAGWLGSATHGARTTGSSDAVVGPGPSWRGRRDALEACASIQVNSVGTHDPSAIRVGDAWRRCEVGKLQAGKLGGLTWCGDQPDPRCSAPEHVNLDDRVHAGIERDGSYALRSVLRHLDGGWRGKPGGQRARCEIQPGKAV